jgi:hypothetical protein
MMRELIRHILKENNLKQELKKIIEDDNIFKAADLVGGMDNLKSIFKDDPEYPQMLDGLTGVVDFEYHDAFKDPRFVVFPIKYEIIGVEKNIWGTHSWPLLNVIYDDSKLTSAEKKKLITILATIQNDSTVGKIETNLPEIKNSNYFDVRQINGNDVDIHDVEFPFSKEDVIRIHNKLYGESESLNESVPAQVRRRNEYFDMFFKGKRKNINYCSFRHPDHLMNYLLELTLEDLYHAWFYQTVTYEEWEESIPYIENYIKEKYYDETVELWKNKCGGRRLYESEGKQPKYLGIIKDIVEPFKNEDCVCDIKVSYDEDDMYLIDVEVGLFDLKEKFYAEVGRNHYVKKIRVDLKEAIKGYIPIDNFYVGSHATPKCGEKRWWDKNINESENKEQSLQKLIDQYGLYDFIKMSGLNFNQVKSILNKMGNPKELLKQYIREFVLEKGGSTGENYGSIFAVQIPLSDTKYVEDILVHDEDSIAVEMWEYHLDEYGHREQKDQYLTTINSLTNDELLTILAWMMETIKEGSWDY